MTTTAQTTLLNIGTRRYGKTVLAPTHIIKELQNLGYLGTGGGLTRKGSIKREEIILEEEKKIFGDW